nr:hypothetical protein CFP56_25275 [Quercus suber]
MGCFDLNLFQKVSSIPAWVEDSQSARKGWGKLYNTRQVKVIKLRLKIADCGRNVWSISKRHAKCRTS